MLKVVFSKEGTQDNFRWSMNRKWNGIRNDIKVIWKGATSHQRLLMCLFSVVSGEKEFSQISYKIFQCRRKLERSRNWHQHPHLPALSSLFSCIHCRWFSKVHTSQMAFEVTSKFRTTSLLNLGLLLLHPFPCLPFLDHRCHGLR